MSISVEAIYQNGILRPLQPLPYPDGEKVSIDVRSLESPLLKAYGIMGWKGTSEELDRLLAEIESDEDDLP